MRRGRLCVRPRASAGRVAGVQRPGRVCAAGPGGDFIVQAVRDWCLRKPACPWEVSASHVRANEALACSWV